MTADEPVGDLRALANAATPGPWEWDRTPGGEWGHQPPDLQSASGECVLSSYGYDSDGVTVGDADAAFIAAANPAAIIQLLDQLAEAERLAQALADALGEEIKADGRGYGPPELDPAVAALTAWNEHQERNP